MFATACKETANFERPKLTLASAFNLVGIAAKAASAPFSSVSLGAHILLNAAMKESKDKENEEFVSEIAEKIRKSLKEGTRFAKDVAELASAHDAIISCAAETNSQKAPYDLKSQPGEYATQIPFPANQTTSNYFSASDFDTHFTNDTTPSPVLPRIDRPASYISHAFNLGCDGISLVTGAFSDVITGSNAPGPVNDAPSAYTSRAFDIGYNGISIVSGLFASFLFGIIYTKGSSLLFLPLFLGYQVAASSIVVVCRYTWKISRYLAGLDAVKIARNSVAVSTESVLHSSVDNACSFAGKSAKVLISFATGMLPKDG